MKKNKSNWKNLLLVIGISSVATCGLLLSCEKETIKPEENYMNKSSQGAEMPQELFRPLQICGTIQKKDIVVGERKDIGDMYIFNDTKYLYVHAIADDRFLLKNAYLFTGLREEIPETAEGNLNYELFTHTQEALSYARSRHFKVPLSELHGKFLVSLMVETKPVNAQSSAFNFNSWADGYTYGVTPNKIGRIFTYIKGVCESIDHDDAFTSDN